MSSYATHRAVLGALWSILYGSDVDGVLQEQARSKHVHRVVRSAPEDLDETAAEEVPSATELATWVLECIG